MSVLAGWAEGAQARGEPVAEILGLEPGPNQPINPPVEPPTEPSASADAAEFG